MHHTLGMNEWLDGLFGMVRCANCGAVYGQASVAVVGNREDRWFVRCACQACGTQGLGVVIVKRVADAPPLVAPRAVFSDDDERSLCVDHVLEAHDLLRDYVGDVNGLFEKVTRT